MFAKKKATKPIIEESEPFIGSPVIQYEGLIRECLVKLSNMEKKMEKLELIESHLLDLLLPNRKHYIVTSGPSTSIVEKPKS